ncbi:lipopolysaccharide assembly protein LapB [uncultured Methanobrevibacter sp.]|uniref:tetratricopeptide repeat protein n=1 Tax=uncultured Methanobrevibacter sp. TaxID=253161 RepID=UPI00260E1A5E|nr:peptide transporter [uncultured Methanobrevibacter sp.]
MKHELNQIKWENMDINELKEEIPIWCNLLKESPEDDRLRIITASLLYFTDEKEKSLKLLKKAPNDNNIRLKEMKAIVYMDLSYYNEALKIFNEILDVDYYNKSVLDLKIDCLYYLKRFEEVIKAANTYLEIFGNNIDILNTKKLGLIELNRKKEAKEVEDLILKIKPYNKFAVYIPKDEIDEVIPKEAYEKELKLCFDDLKRNPNDNIVLISIATFLYNLDDINGCIEYLDKINDDADSITKNAKAKMYMKLEKFEEALNVLNSSLKGDDHNIVTYISKTDCLLKLKQYEEVLKNVDIGLKIDNTNIQLWENKFFALIELNRVIEAKEVQDLIFDLEIAEDKVEGSLKKAINLYYSKDYRECLNLCYDILDIDKNNQEAAAMMIDVVYLLGDIDEVPKVLLRAINCNGGEILTKN